MNRILEEIPLSPFLHNPPTMHTFSVSIDSAHSQNEH